MNLLDLIPLLVATGLILALFSRLPGIWAGDIDLVAALEGHWPDVVFLRGVNRAAPILIMSGWAAVAAKWASAAGPGLGFSVSASVLSGLATAALFAGAAAFAFNQPKFLVPIPLRSQPGALDEWRGADF